ncbi:IPT/TIG domain-containing protein [bacterium]|nr:IPT/TIG domain-containing protein [bacterium]
MATKFQIKRTSVSGRTPNTTNAANSSYIAAGELALNLSDKKMYSSNGTNYFEIGAFKVEFVNSTSNVSTFTEISTLQFDEDSGFDVTNPSAGVAKVAMNSTFKYWQVDGVQKLTATGLDTVNFIAGNNITITANGTATPQEIAFATSLTPTFNSVTFGNSTVNTTINSTSIAVTKIFANGSAGSAGKVLSANSTGGIYWDVSAGGGSTFTVTSDTFNGNGSNTVFTLTTSSSTDKSFVYLNGVQQAPTTDYTVSGTTLTFVVAPPSDNVIEVRSFEIPSVADITVTSDTFTANGTQTDFTLSTSDSSVTKSLVFLNGVTQVPTTDYTITNATLQFVAAPTNNTAVQAISFTVADVKSAAFTGNGTNTQFTLPVASTTSKTIVAINGVTQTPVTDYSVSGTTLIFAIAPVNNDKILVRVLPLKVDSAGGNTQVQYNKSGILGGSAGFTFNESTNNVTIGNTLTVPNLRINASNPPANSTSSGAAGTVAWDSNYFYVAVATDTWKKTPITTDGAGGGGGSANTAGSNTEIQFNDSGVLGANNLFTFDKDTTTLAIGSNLTVNTSTIFIGNSTVNTTITAGNVHLQGTQLTVGNVVLTGEQITIGNSTVNTVITANSFGIGMARQSFTGNGSNTQFTLSSEPTDESHTFVFVDRVIQRDSDYSISGAVLTFASAPDNSSDIDVYIARAGVSQSPAVGYSVTRDEFTGNGSNTEFSMSVAPQSEAHVLVFVDGIIQRNSDFNVSGSTLTFTSAPENTSEIQTFVYQSAVALAGGSNTNIVFNDSTTANGSAGFTFNKTTNNVTIGNTLSVGNSTVNTVIRPNGATFSGDLMPSANVTYDIGNSSMRWKDLWLSGSTINLGGASIKTDTDTGAIALIPKPTDATPNPVAVVVSPTGGITTVETTGGVPAANAVAEAAVANTATPVPIDITTAAPANGQALIWSTAANTFVPGNVAVSGGSSDIPKITGLVYPDDDTAANTSGGQTVYISGSNFAANCVVYINGSAAPSVSFISSSNVGFTTPALSANIYPVYVINPGDGATAIHIPGLNVSGVPNWSTAAGSLGDADAESAWSFNVSATSDSSVTYTLAGGSSLPSGITLASNGLISGTLSSPPASETTYNFSIVATDGENQDASRSFSVSVTLGDPYFYLTTLLIHADGTNNQNNHTFLDSTANNLAITRTGTPTQGSFSPFSQTGWSGYFDGSGDFLSWSGSTIGTQPYTAELWFYAESVSSLPRALFGTSAISGLNIRIGSTTTISVDAYNNSATQFTVPTITAGRWYHLAVVRNASNVTTVFLDGVRSTTGAVTISTNYAAISKIGQSAEITDYNGFISNARLVIGSALYDPTQSSISVPTSPLSAVSGTSLLTCHTNGFVDASTNAFNVVRNGNTIIQPFSPFTPSAAYTAGGIGGSVYIPAGTNGLTVSSVPTIGSGNFTVEGWFWPTDDTARSEFDSAWTTNAGNLNGVDSMQGAVRSSHVIFRSNGTSDISAAVSIANRWSHIAWVRNGTTVTIYVNGTSVVSGTYSNSLAGGNLYISRPDSSQFRFNGWISGFRILAGTAQYTGNFTPPTSPPTAITNTIALLNFTNAGIFDQTARNVLETVGDAKVSTAQYKYGTGSIAFDGTGDYARVPYNSLMQLPGDFTVECWVYPISKVSNFPCIFNNYSTYTTNGGFAIFAGHNSGNTSKYQVSFNGSFPVIQSSSNIAYNSWTHIALVRSGSTLTLYINGASEGTSTQTAAANGTQNYYWIGAAGDELANSYFNGYIDDLRITKGYARYTTNFTPPTSAFKNR